MDPVSKKGGREEKVHTSTRAHTQQRIHFNLFRIQLMHIFLSFIYLGTGKMTEHRRALASPAEDDSQQPNDNSQLCATLVPVDPISSSLFHGHQAYPSCANIYAHKAFI